jgi:hypothetical protein
MKRKAVGYIAAFAAAVSLGALGYAVLWGVNPADLGRPAPDMGVPHFQLADEIAKALARQKKIAGEIAKEVARPWPRRRPVRIVLAPAPAGTDAAPAGSLSRHAASSIEARPATPGAPPDEASALGPDAPMPAVPGEDAPSTAAASPRLIDIAVAIEDRLPEPATPGSELMPQAAAAEPPADVPTMSPDPEPVGTIAPAAEPTPR